MERASLNLAEVGNKGKSKWELYRLLTVEGGLYLPPEEQTNMEFISDVFFDEKKVRNMHLIDFDLTNKGSSFERCYCVSDTSC